VSGYLDFNLIKDLSVVNPNNSADHLRDNNHITKVGFDAGGFVISSALELGLAKALDQGKGLALEATVEASTSSAVNEIDEL